MTKHTQSAFRMAAALLVASLLTAPVALAAIPEQPSLPEAGAASPADLKTLATVFGEEARSTSTDASASCGASGHCNFVGCPDPGCAAGYTATYQCTATVFTCEDSHDWYNPFDNDEHVVYNCSSACQREENGPEPGPEPEPTCTVKNPLGDGCLVPGCETETMPYDPESKMAVPHGAVGGAC